MKTYPLLRRHLSNEHILTALFVVLLVYLRPVSLLHIVVVGAIGIAIDAVWNIIRYKKPVCSGSAAVTAGILLVLSGNAPLHVSIVGICLAIVLGKQIWGGMGKNIVNPALVGLLVMAFLWPLPSEVFSPSPICILAMLLSLPFLLFRPFAGLGLMAGMVLSLFLTQNLSLQSIVSYGVLFWGALVITDPVTVTPRPVFGFWGALTVGAAAVLLTSFYSISLIVSLSIGILVFNIASFLAKRKIKASRNPSQGKLKIKKAVPDFNGHQNQIHDLTGLPFHDVAPETEQTVAPQEILNILETAGVVGMGGAGFPVSKKIQAVLNSGVEKKYLIINGVECDPGLVHDQWILHQFPEEIHASIKILARIIHFDKIILAVKSANTIRFPGDIEIVEVPDYYPVGAERFVIKEVLGMALP